MYEFIDVPKHILTANLVDLGCEYANLHIVLRVASDVLLLGQYCLNAVVLLIQVLQVTLDLLLLLLCREIEFLFEVNLQVHKLTIIAFELVSSLC